jgi:hypothetical protein
MKRYLVASLDEQSFRAYPDAYNDWVMRTSDRRTARKLVRRARRLGFPKVRFVAVAH